MISVVEYGKNDELSFLAKFENGEEPMKAKLILT